MTPYGARLIITQICSSFTDRQHTSRAFACPRRYMCNTCRACPFSCTFFRSFSLSHLAFSLSLPPSLSLLGAHSNRYNFADLRSDLCICHGTVCEIRLVYTGCAKPRQSFTYGFLNFKLILLIKREFIIFYCLILYFVNTCIFLAINF